MASMWILGVVVIVVMVACIAAIFLGGGEQGPFVAVSRYSGRRYRPPFQSDLEKPRNENELL
jgi:hypothetical protein